MTHTAAEETKERQSFGRDVRVTEICYRAPREVTLLLQAHWSGRLTPWAEAKERAPHGRLLAQAAWQVNS